MSNILFEKTKGIPYILSPINIYSIVNSYSPFYSLSSTINPPLEIFSHSKKTRKAKFAFILAASYQLCSKNIAIIKCEENK